MDQPFDDCRVSNNLRGHDVWMVIEPTIRTRQSNKFVGVQVLKNFVPGRL
jgi:hypothetical protein